MKLALFAFNGEPMCFAHVLVKEMSGHPSIGGYLVDGYDVMPF